jgi:hypothetical protein
VTASESTSTPHIVMNWTRNIGATVIEDSRCTLNAVACRTVDALTFARMIRGSHAQLRMTTVESLQSVSNAAAHRVHGVCARRKSSRDSAEMLARIAYPPSDRPRGKRDIDSVLYHIANRACDPIVVHRSHDGVRTLLDGAHRLIAAAITGCDVLVLMIHDVDAGICAGTSTNPPLRPTA